MATNDRKISKLARSVQKDPADTFSKFALALELLKVNRVEKAQVLFEAILKQDPEYLGVYYHLGKLYQQRGMFKKAEKLFRDGVKLAEMKGDLRTKSELSEAIIQLQYETED